MSSPSADSLGAALAIVVSAADGALLESSIGPAVAADVGPAKVWFPLPAKDFANELELGFKMVSDGLPPPVASGAVGTSALRFAANEPLFT